MEKATSSLPMTGKVIIAQETQKKARKASKETFMQILSLPEYVLPEKVLSPLFPTTFFDAILLQKNLKKFVEVNF